jgi:Transposase IS66 family
VAGASSDPDLGGVERVCSDHASGYWSILLRTEASPPSKAPRTWLRLKTALPKSATGKAASYTLALWSKLKRFFEHPELKLFNNLAENSMRPIAVGRKNWIHLGRAQAGPKIAAIFSVVKSCRRLNIPVRDLFHFSSSRTHGGGLPGLGVNAD